MIDNTKYKLINNTISDLLNGYGFKCEKKVGKSSILYVKKDPELTYMFELLLRKNLKVKGGISFNILRKNNLSHQNAYNITIYPKSSKLVYSYDEVEDYFKAAKQLMIDLLSIKTIPDAMYLFENEFDNKLYNFNHHVGYFIFGLISIYNEDQVKAEQLLKKYVYLVKSSANLGDSAYRRLKIATRVIEQLNTSNINKQSFENVVSKIVNNVDSIEQERKICS